MIKTDAPRHRIGTALLVLTLSVTGCAEYIDPYVPEPIRPFTEPEYATQYLLYRPSHYDRGSTWPLIIACPGLRPDSPNRHIRSWTQLAEGYGFLVAVPTLQTNRRTWRTPDPIEQIPRLRADERLIQAVVKHVRAGHNISDDRIFIHGASAGAHAALLAGMKNPDVFRALALSDPLFDKACLVDLEHGADPHQPILLRYQLSDKITGENATRCRSWLTDRSTELRVDTHGGSDTLDAEDAVSFFEDVVRSRPWIRVRGFPAPGDNPLAMQFKLQTSCRLESYHWRFSDGGESTEAQPLHVFPSPGTYRVQVTVSEPGRSQHRRAIDLSVPEAAITARTLTQDSTP